jgi:predicted nucleotidyltransferase
VAPVVDERLARFRAEYLPRLVAAFRPARVLAFGSRVRGDALKDSDLDLVVVAERFREVRWLDRAPMVVESLGAPFALEVLCYTPEEYAAKSEELGIVRTATLEGLDLLRIPVHR